MPAYASQLDVESAYGVAMVNRLADQDGDGIAEQETIDAALESASSFIDSYISVRYPVPVVPATPILRDLAIDIAWYRMAYNKLKQTDEMRLRYDDAIRMLERISDGKAGIGLGTETGGGTSDEHHFSARVEWLKRA